MEGEVGAQMAPPIYIQQSLYGAPPLPKKRDLSWQNPSFNLNSAPNWNPNRFDWDSVNFAVKPSSNANDLAKRFEEEEGGESLTLKLGGGGGALGIAADRAAGRPSKKVRAGSPGSGGGTYPMCQVDDCKVDLSSAKDYHRRHKVCEVHSKMTKVVVGKQMQRFCQQCSRFHLLSEFDEGKRSCRRRLAGHNRRRRKTQPEDTSARLLSPQNQGIGGNSNLELVKFLSLLARFQDKVAGAPLIPDKEQLNQILSKINSMRAATTAPKSPVPEDFDLNVSQVSEQPSIEQSAKVNGNPSTVDLLAVLSSALSQAGSDDTENQLARFFSSVGSTRNDCILQTQLKEPQPTLPLQLFSSTENVGPPTPPQMGSTRKYASSESSNLMDDRSPSSSPPFAQNLFPLHSAAESREHERMSICREDNASVVTGTSEGWSASLGLSKKSETRDCTVQNFPFQAGYTSSTGSDHSPSSSNSDGQDRTGRIIFKLFDKDPNNLPGALRSQILNWLSNSPSEMESYIRPGCVVLSIYASMSSGAWDALERNLVKRVSSLVYSMESEFWRNGRFLVLTNTQLASFKDGKIRLCKSWKTWSAPELAFVSPIAVVSGQETSFVLKGRNLTSLGTRIHCTYMGGYLSKEVFASAYLGTTYNGSSIETSFSLHGGLHGCFGRCFIEVENGFKGNSFPVIIANATVCQELRALESDFDGDRTDADVMHFLNELGWLFQRKNIHSHPSLTNFAIKRFNFLLTFSIERDWSALVKTLLDMLVERSIEGDGSVVEESLEMLLEVQLLSRAVKRKCRKMVDLLLNYSVKGSNNESKRYLFPPNSAGPCEVTPLHLAASSLDSDDMVDALTNDPQEIGLNCWNSLIDESGQSPFMYASMRNNHTYNKLVARKLGDKNNQQISISIGNPGVSTSFHTVAAKTCARCSLMDAHHSKPIVRTRGLLYRPYIHSLLGIAAVCVCVCLLMRGMPRVSTAHPFRWEKLEYGPR